MLQAILSLFRRPPPSVPIRRVGRAYCAWCGAECRNGKRISAPVAKCDQGDDATHTICVECALTFEAGDERCPRH